VLVQELWSTLDGALARAEELEERLNQNSPPIPVDGYEFSGAVPRNAIVANYQSTRIRLV